MSVTNTSGGPGDVTVSELSEEVIRYHSPAVGDDDAAQRSA